MNRILLVISLLLPASQVIAQEKVPTLTPQLVPIWQKHAIAVVGSTNPTAIPYGIAMERAFWDLEDQHTAGLQAFGETLRTRFPVTEADVQTIARVSADSLDFSALVRNEASESYDQLCAELVGAKSYSLNALDVAARFEAIERDEAARLTTHYSTVLSTLSPGARSGLEATVETDIRPRLNLGA